MYMDRRAEDSPTSTLAQVSGADLESLKTDLAKQYSNEVMKLMNEE